MFESKRKLKKQLENAEKRETEYFRKLYKIEWILREEEENKTPAVHVVDKIKEVINPVKVNNF